MVRNPSGGASASDTNSINLSRMVGRLQQILVNPDSATETKLRTSRYEREKVGTNLEYARSLLIGLEQEVHSIRHPIKKQETQTDLARKREILHMLDGRLQELNQLGEQELDDDSSEGEDLLGEDTPDDETDQDPTPPPTASSTTTENISTPLDPDTLSPPYTHPSTQPPPSELRARTTHAKERAELLSKPETSGTSTATSEALLTHNRHEQENLTTSLLSMAAQLKQQSRAFAHSLESEKEILNRAVDGLDRNEQGLEQASRKMGFLRGYTEGKGWWGRMLMYVWIFALMITALVVVFVLPKLRF